MTNIEKIGNSLIFDKDGVQYVFPLNSLILISNDDSKMVNVRLKASRKNLLQFLYDECNISSTSANDLITKINEL